MTSTENQANLGTSPPMSRVEWAIARYNCYRAGGLLKDPPQQNAENATYQRSPDPPPPKPHLKWYPLSKQDDIAATYQQPVASTQRHRYSQTVEDARTLTTLAPHHSENEEKATQDDPRTWSHGDWAVDREFREQMFDRMRALGAKVDKSKAAHGKLAEEGAEAMVSFADDAAGNRVLTASFGPSPTRSALREEYIHLIQLQKGGLYDQLVNKWGHEIAEVMMEIAAKREIIRDAKKWKIPYDEIEGLRNAIVEYERTLAKLTKKD